VDRQDAMKRNRRGFLQAAAAALAASALPQALHAQGGASKSLKIGVIGSGRIGGTVGELWVKAGHRVMFSSLDLDHDKTLAARVGAGARAGTPREAAAFGEVLLVSVPYSALPQLGRDLGDRLKGKVVLDTCNPIPGRDGDMALEAKSKGTGIVSPRLLPGARLVRAFNSVGYSSLQSEAHRDGDRLGIPIAGDDASALKVVEGLVRDAGFDPVVVGPLRRGKEFEPDTPVYNTGMSGAELRRALGLSGPG